MEKSALEQIINSYFASRKTPVSPTAVRQLLSPRFMLAETLEKTPEAEIRKGLEAVLGETLKHFSKRCKRLKASTREKTLLRDVDARVAVRNAAQASAAPYGKIKAEKPSEGASA